MNRLFRTTFRNLMPVLLAGLGWACATGCQSLPRSGLDPYGERLFESCPFTGLKMPECNLFGTRKDSPTTTPSTITATPVPSSTPASVYTNQETTPGLLPGSFGAAQPGSAAIPQYGSTATAGSPGYRGINTALIASPDAGPRPIFEDTGGYALPTQPVEGPALLMTPREQIAPVGSEVVLISSYLGKKDHLITNEKVEWTLEGTGSILKFDQGSCCDPLYFDYVRAKKVTDRYAVTKTSQVYQTLDRGTPETSDDIHLLRGQTWISVNSMREGTTHVTAFAPTLKDWSKRSDFGIIHWVDAQWVLPTLPIAPVGESRVLTTTVLRRTNGQPRPGWIVRYEIMNGPPAGFGSGGSLAQIEEVETDLSGQASIVLSQREMQSGTNTIAVRIIRPAGVDGSDRRVTVGNETIRQTWTGSAGVRIQIQGPATVSRGQDIPYALTLSNNTSTLARGTVVVTVPPLVSYISSNPPARQEGDMLQWDVTVPPNGSTAVQLVLKGGTAGRITPSARFYPQGISPQPNVAPSIRGTSVPPPSGSGSLGVVRGPADSIPTLPNATQPSATVYSGTPSTPGPGATPYSPSATSASVFSNLKLSIDPVVDPAENLVFQVNKPCRIKLGVQNTGATPIRNIVLQLNIPTEYGKLAGVNASPGAKLEGQNSVSLNVPSLPAGGNAGLELSFPTIAQQGYTFLGKALVDGKPAGDVQKKIVPPR